MKKQDNCNNSVLYNNFSTTACKIIIVINFIFNIELECQQNILSLKYVSKLCDKINNVSIVINMREGGDCLISQMFS